MCKSAREASNQQRSDTLVVNAVELVEYAAWLGMNLPGDKEMLWIARAGLKSPLPDHWKPWYLTSSPPSSLLESKHFNYLCCLKQRAER